MTLIEQKKSPRVLACETIIILAKGEVGVREIGSSNTGRRVQEYQAATTLGGTGWPWCSGFYSWLIRETAKEMGIDIAWIFSASCDEVLAWARRRGIVYERPQAGDAGLCMASKYDATHIFLVTDVDASTMHTVEGNTNDTGSREGNGVYARTRENSSRYLFVRWLDLLPNEVQEPPLWTVTVGTRSLQGPNIEGLVHVPAREWGKLLGLPVEWNATHQCVLLQGREVAAQVRMIGGAAYLPVRALANFSGLRVDADAAARRIEVSR